VVLLGGGGGRGGGGMERSDRGASSAPSHEEPAEPLTDDDIPF